MQNPIRVDQAMTPAASHAQQWTGGVLAFLLLLMGGGAWVCLIGVRPCVLSSLFWR